MGQQVGDDELGVLRLVADAHIDLFHLAVVAHADHAAQLERDRGPLVLFDAAVVVGLEERHAAVLIERHGADVHARRIQMRGGQAHALRERLFADHRERDALVAVDLVDLVAGLEGVVARPGMEALLLRKAHHFLYRVALGLALVEELLVVLGIGLHILFVAAGQLIEAGFFVVKQLFRSHFCSPLLKMVYKASVSRHRAARSPLFSMI